ncbi:hypothetical protein TNCT_204021 [Trichonephila clavata]|uniref:Uncharacterized protein n=1 Tax=Trichonephila clavata TaxID=2740835 RepID=A0A8X6HCB2_TRICU|nr:hypothetical protein TNCT_204021 [Trichonephila clavata]
MSSVVCMGVGEGTASTPYWRIARGNQIKVNRLAAEAEPDDRMIRFRLIGSKSSGAYIQRDGHSISYISCTQKRDRTISVGGGGDR